MVKIVVDRDIPFIEKGLRGWCEPVFLSGREITREALGDAEGLLIRTYTRCDRSLLEGTGIRFIATGTIGMDHIDTAWCAANGITVRNSPGCNAPGVAQYVWSSIAALGIAPEGLRLGVVGKGNVGSIVTEWGRRLGATVLVCDPPRQRRGLDDEKYLPLENVLEESDIVTIHTPLTREGDDRTFHMIGEKEMGLMRPGTILINASRGATVDSTALRVALEKKHIRGVIDTWVGEPSIDTSLLPLVDIGTFHIAGYSHEGKQRATRMILEAAGEFFGTNPDTSGLAGAYTPPEDLSMQRILDSYDPRKDMAALLSAPEKFLHLRDTYDFRHEVV